MLQQETQLQGNIAALRTRLLVMAAGTQIAVDGMADSLKTLDEATAQRIFDSDDVIDGFENEIDAASLNILALGQPVAGDLRFVVATLRMVVDFERIADEAATICGQVLLMRGTDVQDVLKIVQTHLNASMAAFKRALEALRCSKIQDALAMCGSDDDAVQSEVAVLQHLVEQCRAGGVDNLHDTEFVMHMILVVHSLTRIWRRSINIAGHICFAAIGDSQKHGASKNTGRHFGTPDSEMNG